MKIFKTILWTSLFWIIVIAGLWVASLFFPHEASIIIPWKVKTVIIEAAGIEALDNHEVVKVDETALTEEEVVAPEVETTEEEIIEENPTVDEVVAPVEEEIVQEEVIAEPAKNSIIPQPTQTQAPAETNEEIEALKNRIAVLEAQYEGLVEELRTIFSTPVFTQLLEQAFANNQVTEETY